MSYYTSIQRHSYKWVMLIVTHIWMRHVVTHELWHNTSATHLWMCHDNSATHMNASCCYTWVVTLDFSDTHMERVMFLVAAHIWMRHVVSNTHMTELCFYEWVITPDVRVVWATHKCKSHVTHMNESRHTYESVTTHVWLSHDVTYEWLHQTLKWFERHTDERVMSHIWMSHVTHMNESRHTY